MLPLMEVQEVLLVVEREGVGGSGLTVTVKVLSSEAGQSVLPEACEAEAVTE